MGTIANIFWLGTKELRSFGRDFVLLGFVIYSFSLAVYAQAQSNSQELHNAAIAIVDEDHSHLSRQIARGVPAALLQAAAGDRRIRDRPGAGYRALHLRPRHPAQFRARCRRRARAGDPGRISMRPRWFRPASVPATSSRSSTPRSRASSGAAIRIPSRRSTSRSASRSIPTSPPPGSPASWGSSTTSRCWRSFWPAPRSSASASTARWTIC